MKKKPHEYLLHRAFTMLELVFVIIVIGILAAVIIPNTKSNPLAEAAVQLASHIRYTQHLAMIDDKYDSSDPDWYKERWQIFFANTAGSDGKWAYSIFSDFTGTSTGTPDVSELAVNPQDSDKFLTGGYSTGTVAYGDSRATKKLNLGNSYGITNITFSNTCTDGSKRIAFDHLGRPVYENHRYLDSLYQKGNNNRLLTQNCDITLHEGTKAIVLRIAPETGYTCILDSADKCI